MHCKRCLLTLPTSLYCIFVISMSFIKVMCITRFTPKLTQANRQTRFAAQIFYIHYFFAEGKKVKGCLGMMWFGDGVGRFMDFPSVHPFVSASVTRLARYNSHVVIATVSRSISACNRQCVSNRADCAASINSWSVNIRLTLHHWKYHDSWNTYIWQLFGELLVIEWLVEVQFHHFKFTSDYQ